jgi:type IV pilus assembly protein PilN
MIRINLLPFRTERKKENVRRQLSFFLVSLIGVLIVLIYYNFNLNAKIGKLNKKITTTKAELKRYEEINKEIARIKQTLENLKKKLAVIDQLESDRHAPVRLMDTMTQVLITNRMWLVSLDDQETSVTISGIALDNKTVADFMVGLQNSGLFSNVNLKSIKHQEVQKAKLKGFQITCTKTAPQQPEPPKTTNRKKVKA